MIAPGVNAQYNVAEAGSLPVRIAAAARRRMFETYLASFPAAPADTVLDVGVTSEQSYEASNYFEAWYPYKDRITALGLDDASFLQDQYPGLRFVRGNALDMPFADGEFDIVHSSAVIEHVGSVEQQARYVAELCRTARRGVFFTTPNRWFPIEFHTLVPLLHWLPKPAFRALVRPLRGDFFSREENLNLLTASELRRLCAAQPGFDTEIRMQKQWGWPSNILVVMRRRA